MNKATIYIFTNILNGKQYIGKTEREFDVRLSEHFSHARCKSDNNILHKDIRKYGVDNFHIECLQVPKHLVNLWEKHLIKRWKSKVPNGYNLTDGGEGICGLTKLPWNKGKPRSDNTKRKISISKKGKLLGSENPKAREIILIHPNGEEEKFGCMIDGATKYNLNYSCLNAVARNDRNHTSGFKCRYVKEKQ